ncbi:THUMP domain-containing protein 3 [Elysia marginata]|uniref:THUMP domain-containing protein 3 n=1 Tax=Elysia marginata TaxID=1093978 RepID=A0AAV4EYR7_9GAST|nr:THUMP domain-containing protein 3 [Elysia marginata]
MASAGDTSSEGFETLCTIEASVVTGFEECARGEAKEKFEADVKTSRGKINWKIPMSRLPEVLKMKSIDNCRVVMHTVPHFKFTDQNDSLARIQKMILDIDWETGLRAWKQLFDFPYPIASRPDIIPSPEDLVDVVVMTRLPQPKDKQEKKKKNQGKGKGKKKSKDRRQGQNQEMESEKQVSQQEGLNTDAGDTVNPEDWPDNTAQAESVEKTTDAAEGAEKSMESESQSYSGAGDFVDMKLERSDRDFSKVECEEADLKSEKDSKDGESSKNECSESSSDDVRCDDSAEKIIKSDYAESAGSAGVDLMSEKTVIDNAVDDTEKMKPAVQALGSEDEVSENKEAYLEDGSGDGAKNELGQSMKVPDREDAFKSELSQSTEVLEGEECKPQAIAAPKVVVVKKVTSAEIPEIDIKVLNQPPTENVFPTALESKDLRHLEPMEVDSPNASFNLRSTLASSEKGEEETRSDTKDNANETKSDIIVDSAGNNSPTSSPTSAAAAFASSIINRLCSPPTSPTKENLADTTCTTPPSTPIASIENPFYAISNGHASNGFGSSVDPEPYNKDVAITVPDSQLLVLSEPTVSSSNILTEISALELEGRPSQTETPACEPCEESKEAQVTSDKDTNAQKSSKPEPDPTKPKFRVTCNRVGEHPFDSSSAAASFGSAVITYFKWPVDLKKFDIEVLLNIDNEEVSVSIALTKTSLHNRNMVAFGPTTLRPTICYNMLRLCRIRNGDFICDPMCGTSAIPIESALNWTNCFTFGGDFHEKAIERTAVNISAIDIQQKENNKSHLKLDAVQWNINNFPLRDSCVDVFISDLVRNILFYYLISISPEIIAIDGLGL